MNFPMTVRAHQIALIQFDFHLFPRHGVAISCNAKVFLRRVPVVKIQCCDVFIVPTPLTFSALILRRHLFKLTATFRYRFYTACGTTPARIFYPL